MRRRQQWQGPSRTRRKPSLALLLVAFLFTIRTSEGFQLAPGTILNRVPMKPTLCEDVYEDCDERISALQELSESSHVCDGQTELLEKCRRTCGSCEPPSGPAGEREAPDCEDEAAECQEWATSGECSEVSDQCKKSCGLCEVGDEELGGFQGGLGGHKGKANTKRKKKAMAQRHDLVPSSKCHDRLASCEALAAVKWCIHDPLFMQAMCPESCYMCAAASSEVLERVSTLEQVFSGEAIKAMQGTDRDRFIPGIDPVFKESQAEMTELMVEKLDMVGMWLMRRYQPYTSAAQRKPTVFLVKDIEEDVEHLERAPGKEALCTDWHPTCGTLMQNGECIERPYEMGIICQEACGFCKPPEDEWEMPVMDPEVRGWFGGTEEQQAEGSLPPGSRERDGEHQQPPPLERATMLPWVEDERDAGEDAEEAPTPRSSGGHIRGRHRKSTKRSPGDGPIQARDLGDHRKLFPTVGISLNGLGNSTGDLVQAAIGAGVTRFEALLLAPGDPDAARLDLFREALNSSGVPRSAVYLGLAVHPDGFGSVIRQLLEGLKELRMGYVDMAILASGSEQTHNWHKLSLHSWKGLQRLHGLSIARALGGAGLGMSAYTFLARRSSVKFRVFQKPVDPFYPDRKGVDFSFQKGITYVGTHILGDPNSKDGSVSEDPTLVALASTLGQSVATVVVRWALQRGLALTLSRQDLPTPIEALRVATTSFELQDQEMAVVGKLVRADPPPPPAALGSRKGGGGPSSGSHKAAGKGGSSGGKAGAQKVASSGPGDREVGKGPLGAGGQHMQQ